MSTEASRSMVGPIGRGLRNYRKRTTGIFALDRSDMLSLLSVTEDMRDE